MRWLVNYIRQVFCKHEFIANEGYVKGGYDVIFGQDKSGIKVSMICPKCGYHKNFWKY